MSKVLYFREEESKIKQIRHQFTVRQGDNLFKSKKT